MALYQDIMNVPGLTGTWKERANQYTDALYGKKYDGSLETGLDLLKQIKNKNFPQVQQQVQQQAQPQAAAQPVVPLANQYTDPMTGQVIRGGEIPQFENVMPFMDTWEQRLQPGALQAGREMMAPEMLRNYNAAREGYMGQLASSGGYRMGRGFTQDNSGGGLAGAGALKASSERNYNANMQDWLGQQRGGFEDLWYNKQKDIWNKARTQIQPGEEMGKVEIPTWSNYYDKYGPASGAGENTSLLYN